MIPSDPDNAFSFPQKLYLSINGVESELTSISIREYNTNLNDDYTRYTDGPFVNTSLFSNIAYNIIFRYTYDTSGSFISNPISVLFKRETINFTGSQKLFFINTMFCQSNNLFLSIKSGFRRAYTNIQIFRSNSNNLLGDRITTVTPVFTSDVREFHGDKLNILRLSTGNITPGTPYYFTLKMLPASTSYNFIDSSGNTRTGNDASGNSLIGCSMPFLFTYYLVPNAPTINGIIKSSSGYASITFTPGSSDAPGGISNYLFSTDYFFTKTICNVDSNFGNIIIPLTPGTYSIQIQAVSIAGRSASSNSFSFTMT
jgi:hypothetical protein